MGVTVGTPGEGTGGAGVGDGVGAGEARGSARNSGAAVGGAWVGVEEQPPARKTSRPSGSCLAAEPSTAGIIARELPPSAKAGPGFDDPEPSLVIKEVAGG